MDNKSGESDCFMISNGIVFILGAGASVPYGYPIGSQLRDDICLNFKKDMTGHKESSGGDYGPLKDLIQLVDDFVERFQNSRIRSIDKWLSLNEGYKDIGKLAIVNAIVKRENRRQLMFEGRDKSFDWFSVLFNEMMVGVAMPHHFSYREVCFITFNYDRVFEHLFFESFRNTFPSISLEEMNTNTPSNPHFSHLRLRRRASLEERRSQVRRQLHIKVSR